MFKMPNESKQLIVRIFCMFISTQCWPSVSASTELKVLVLVPGFQQSGIGASLEM